MHLNTQPCLVEMYLRSHLEVGNVQGSNNSVAGNFIFTGTGGDFNEASRELREAFSSGDIREILLLCQVCLLTIRETGPSQISTQCRYQLYQ